MSHVEALYKSVITVTNYMYLLITLMLVDNLSHCGRLLSCMSVMKSYVVWFIIRDQNMGI